jgi:hypothetical protein
MTPDRQRREPDRGIRPDRAWWTGAVVMFVLGAGTVTVWWFFQTHPLYLPQLPGLLP